MFKKLNDGLYFLPVGGLNEIGLNCHLFGVVDKEKEEWIIVDAGVSPHRDNGISLCFAYSNFIEENNIVGIVVTHGHQDHIGSLQFLLKRFKKDVPVYATPFTLDLIAQQLKEGGVKGDLRKIDESRECQVGEFFKISFGHVTHSTIEPNMLHIEAKVGEGYKKILHTGDWKFDDTPLVGPITDFPFLEKVGEEGLDLLLCDSTNSRETIESGSEKDAKDNLYKVIKHSHKKRVIVSCFSSNVARVQSLFEIAKQTGRKVILLGRSLIRFYELALKHGFLQDTEVLDPIRISSLEPSKTMIIATGSQGEPGSILNRLSNGLYKNLPVKDSVFVFSARVIPGNEKAIMDIKISILQQGGEIIDDKDIHVSGHPSQPEIERLIKLCKPKWVIPVHGTLYHLKGVEEVAKKSGVKNTLIVSNGQLVFIGNSSETKCKVVSNIHCWKEGVDGNQIIPMNSPLIKIRESLSKDGYIVVTIRGYGNYIVSAHGVIENKKLRDPYHISSLRKLIDHSLKKNKSSNDQLIKGVSETVGGFFLERYKKNPHITVHIATDVEKIPSLFDVTGQQ